MKGISMGRSQLVFFVMAFSFLLLFSAPSKADSWGGEIGVTAPVNAPPPPAPPAVEMPAEETAEAPVEDPIETEPVAPEVSEPVAAEPPPPSSPATNTDAATDAPLPTDACAAYMNSYEAYTICQDRLQKIQRMIDARNERAARTAPPVKAAPATTSTAPPAPVVGTEAKTETAPAPAPEKK